MTPHASRLPALVDDMLVDAGHPEDAELRAALFTLGSLASLPAPAPSADLARLMAGVGKDIPSGASADELARRRRLIQRPAVLGLALAAGMATGIGGVAASSPVPVQAGSASVQELLEDWRPAWNIAVPGTPEFPLHTAGVGPATVEDPGTDGSIVPAADAGGQPAGQRPAPGQGPGTPGPDRQAPQGNGDVSSGGRPNNLPAPAQDRGPSGRSAKVLPGTGQSRGDSFPDEGDRAGKDGHCGQRTCR